MVKYLKQAETRAPAREQAIRERVSEIIARVEQDGLDAVHRYSAELDDYDAEDLQLSEAQIERACTSVDSPLQDAIDFAIDQVRTFAELQRSTLQDLEVETVPGVVLGHHHIPVDKVGAYVPGGRYSLIASSYMSVVPAKVAGVRQVAVCTPPRQGSVHPALVYAAVRSGADALYVVGGVQALAAMVFGVLPGLDPVDMLVGPGNAYVVEAKRQLFGRVGVDLLAGPTEIGILADATADPFVVACDLVGQAEHDPDSRAVLITTSRQLADSVLGQIDEHLNAVETEPVARACWERGGEVIVVEDLDELVEVSDRYALEHVEVLIENPKSMIPRLRQYGSLFVGPEATVAYGDKVSGSNHILPTHGASRFTGGLWVGKFLKTVTFQHMTPAGSLAMARPCEIEANAEGMYAHARTAAIRRELYAESR